MDFPPEIFDQWAADYDQEALKEEGYPFAGYQKLLTGFIRECDPQPGQRVLDLGCGTGNLGSLFLERGCEVWGIDFSSAMIDIAKTKQPAGHFLIRDIRLPIPNEIPEKYDFIVSAYTFHHFPIHEKIRLIQTLLQQHLNPEGRLLIGDLVFSDLEDCQKTGKLYPDQWDEEEFWILEKDIVPILKAKLNFSVERISFCTSLLEFGLAE
jgi:putative AdoMet-dependent methyltransferase